MTATDKH